MRKRLVAVALAGSALLLGAVPGSAYAGHSDQAHEECKNDAYPAVYYLMENNRVIRVNLRLACVEAPPPNSQEPVDEKCEDGRDPIIGLRVNGQPVVVGSIRLLCIPESVRARLPVELPF